MPKKNIESIYQLSPSQEGMLYDSLSSSDNSRYIEQNIWKIRGDINVLAMEQAWQKVIERHPILRTAFVWKDQKEPLQVVLQEVEPSIQFQDWRKYPRSKQEEILDRNLENIRTRGFNLVRAPLHDMIILQIDEKEYYMIRTIHHIIIDGW
ncbi:condensation protein, partial [Candidatus Poribacteria bacterium]|nr:condensation protein [Candidatus Poribacteria bacterium]